MKLQAPLTYGLPETLRLRRRARNDPLLQQILHYIEQQEDFLNRNVVLKNPDYSTSGVLPRHAKIGLHNHFPKRKGWYSRSLRAFNPDRLEDFARDAHLQGFDIVTVSNYYDDQVFGHEPGITFEFNGQRVIILKSQEVHHVQPFGYHGRIRTGSIDDVVNSTTEKGGLVIMCHPSNLAYNGVGGDLVRRYGNRILIETHSPLANHPSLFFRFADILAKEWSLKYEIPGLSVLDSHNLYFYGGFFVPREYLDMSSPQSAMQSLSDVFEMRRDELHREHSLTSNYIINIEDYPRFVEALNHEYLPAAVTSVRNFSRKAIFRSLRLKDKNQGLNNFEYRGSRKNNLDIFDGQSHIYLLKGKNPAEAFASGQNGHLVFYRRGGKIYVGTSFKDARAYEDSDLKSMLESFTDLQAEFFRETISDPRFQEFGTGLRPAYPIACITPDGEKQVFVGKELLPNYTKDNNKRWLDILYFRIYNNFILHGTETLRLASIQSSLLAEGLNAIPPLYVEFADGKGRIIAPYYKFQDISVNYSGKTPEERKRAMDQAADHLARIKGKRIFLTDMHLGNIATENGDWFQTYDGRFIIRDVNVPGTSLTSFGDSTHNAVNFLNPVAVLFSPRTSFVLKAIRKKHGLIQNFEDFFYFLEAYDKRLEHYRSNR